MRVLSQRIPKSLSDALITKLSAYLQNKNSMIQPEVSFACYLFGETRDPAGKDILLQLTFDDNYKIRASAVNALGKIRYDTSDTEFVNKVSGRLSELAIENSNKKLYNKDIAFALGNYKTDNSFETLLSMLNNSFFGVRFVAADNLQKFPQLPYMISTDSRYADMPLVEIPLAAFMQSLINLIDTDFQSFVGFIKINPAFEKESVIINLIVLIKNKKDKSTDEGFISWCDGEIKELEKKTPLKVK